MTDKPSDDEKPDPDAAFQRTLENMLNKPPRPHKPQKLNEDIRRVPKRAPEDS
jgi:hypothetical protein